MSESNNHLAGDTYGQQRSLEEIIAKIEAEVLGVDDIDRADNFYDFGGTSLQAIRICARIERETGLRAEPLWILETENLAEFAEQLQAEGRQSGGDAEQ